MKPFAQGAEAALYESAFEGRRALRKVRIAKAYRIAQLDLMLRRQRTRREAKTLRAARAAGVNCVEVLADSEENYEIVLQKIGGVLLSREKSISEKQARNAGEELAKLHIAGIVHGDYTTSNLIAAGDSVVVIDFGLSSFTQSVEEKATDLLLFEKSISGAGNEKPLLAAFERGYRSAAKDSPQVFERLKQITARGRYVSQRQ